MVPPGTTVRHRFATTDLDEAYDFVASTYTGHRPEPLTSQGPFQFDVVRLASPHVTVDRLRATLSHAVRSVPFDDVAVVTLTSGRAVVGSPGGVVLGPTEAFMLPVGQEVAGRVHAPSASIVQVPVESLRRVGSALTGLAAGDVRFAGGTPVSSRAAKHWNATQAFFTQSMLEATPEDDALLRQGELNVLLTAMLAAFPNSTLTHSPHDTSWSAPAVVRRAVAHIEANAHQPLTVHDVALAAGVGDRALQAAFRRHLGTTPMAHLRQVRLQRAHQDLRAADPGRGDTVAGIARRWGFASLDRFSQNYRRAYGVTPRETLRR
ncbi:helix-turn-helix transcriptional regulator [Kineococcus sp. SYSU DK003]|uniref:helix-turn-helix transcriptional regulator n=1 Tax=Kineococcus sp. SYSU DK003 TaxID=3383124 RepID=UPI003D7F0C60